jgi:hypothetical protein
MLNRILKIAFVAVLSFSLLVPSAMANAQDNRSVQPKVLFEQPEIKDQNVLFERAKKNISDLGKEVFKPQVFISASHTKKGMVSQSSKEPENNINVKNQNNICNN